MTALRKVSKVSRLSKYIWEKRGRNSFVCLGLAEVSRPGIKKPWVTMVRRAVVPDDVKPWALMEENGKILHFPSAEEAIKAAEAYLEIFNEYQRTYVGNSIDLSHGYTRLSGAQS